MANFCEYEIRVIGTKQACYMVYGAMRHLEEKPIKWMKPKNGSNELFELAFEGSCKWSVNYCGSDEAEYVPELNSMSEDEAEELGQSLGDLSLRALSETGECEIQVHYWSEESEFDQFDQYIEGECIKRRKIEYDADMYSNDFSSPEKERESHIAMATDGGVFINDDILDCVYSVCHIQEKDRNQNIETIRNGDKLIAKIDSYGNQGEKGIEIFSSEGLTLGHLMYPHEYIIDHIEDYDAYVENVTPLSERKKTSKRVRVALLDVRMIMKEEKRAEAYEKQDYQNDETSGVFDWNTLEFIGHEGEYDESVDGEERDQAFMERTFGAMNQVFGQFGVPVANTDGFSHLSPYSGIDAQGEDADFNWTFKERRTVSGTGEYNRTPQNESPEEEYSIMIPDMFEIDEDPESERDFEASSPNADDETDFPLVQILPGEQQPAALDDSNWPAHPVARAAIGLAIGAQMAKAYKMGMGTVPEVLPVASEKYLIYLLVLKTGDKSYSIMANVFTGTIQQMFRVQTQNISSKQKDDLIRSIGEWLKTLQYKDSSIIKKTNILIDNSKCLKDLISGKDSSLKKAAEQAQNEYMITYGANVQHIQALVNNDKINGYRMKKMAEQALRETLDVKLFYAQKIDAVVTKWLETDPDAVFIKKVAKTLEPLHENQTLAVDEEPVNIQVPNELEQILKKWKELGKKRTVSSRKSAVKDRNIKERVVSEPTEQMKSETEQRIQKKEKRVARGKTEAEQEEQEKDNQQEKEARKHWEAKIKYKKEFAAWETACSKAKENRKQFVQDILYKEVRVILQKAEEDKTRAIADANALKNEQMHRKMQAQNTLASLGLFRFSEKKKQKETIEDCERRIEEAQQAIAAAHDTYQNRIDSIDQAFWEEKEKQLRSQAEIKYPFPDKPIPPEGIEEKVSDLSPVDDDYDDDDDDYDDDMENTAIQIQNMSDKDKILAFLKKVGDWRTATDIANEFGWSQSKASALLKYLREGGAC